MLKILKEEDGWKDSWIHEIFYSSVDENCYFVWYANRNDTYVNRYLINFFTHKKAAKFIPVNCESIENSEEKTKCNETFWREENEYQKILKHLKWE